MSLNYYFEPAGDALAPGRLLRFHDRLGELIDEDYLPYLDQHGQMKNLALRIQAGRDDQAPSPSRLHMGETIDRLRAAVGPSVKERRLAI